MDTPHLNRPVSRDRSVSESFTMHPRAGSVTDPTVNGPNARRSDENRSLATLPRAFEGMLKTTTETGDIGMFSIKPSRLPQSTGTPRRAGTSYHEDGLQNSRQTFQPFGVPRVDDRRRLPSYARDATSEVISMYETASQKSASQVFDDPDYRSYSMTHTSYSAYTLSNHRSYASLRSQQDNNGPLQRPRSPFAYPARLRRPGFRPSSPALTDGGVVDYSRRAEIDRATYVSYLAHCPLLFPILKTNGVLQAQVTKTWLQGDHSTSSPSSFYTQKRRPPLSLRQGANRSTPSLLSQHSPPRRSPSTGLRQSNGIVAQDWARRNGSTSGNTSPARSTLSFTSTVNLYATASGTSNATTPGKLAPSSPLYYDYTEDFEVDVLDPAAEPLCAPPLFGIDKTIPEERPSSAGRPPSTECRVHRLSNSARPPCSPSPTPATPKSQEAIQTRKTTVPTEGQFDSLHPPRDEREPLVQQADKVIERKIVRLSGLAYGAQELSTHVEEAFRLLPEKSFELSEARIESKEAISGKLNDGVSEGKGSRIAGTNFTASCPNKVDPHPPRSSSLPSARSGSRTGSIPTPKADRTANNLEPAQIFPDEIRVPRSSTSITGSSRSKEVEPVQSLDSTPASSSTQNRLRSSSGSKSINIGFTELNNLIKTIEKSNRARNPEKLQQVFTPNNTPILAPVLPDGSIPRNTNINHIQTPLMSSFTRSNANVLHFSTRVQPLKRIQPYGGGQKGEASTPAPYQAFNPPNFSDQMAMRAVPHFESPMLAPKPISPARQLKLKNSIPQLMKALPPLPPEPMLWSRSPVKTFKSPGGDVPRGFSPPLPELSIPPVKEMHHEPGKVVSFPQPPIPSNEGILEALVKASSGSSEAASTDQPPALGSLTISQPPPRLKLKIKSSATLRPLFPPSSEPCEMKIDPRSPRAPDTHVSGFFQSEQIAKTKPPKFRLKIIRASSSSDGTVRVNRDSGEAKVSTGFHLRNHKDLFTSTAGIDNIFCQVGQHFHSRKASATSNTGSEPLHPSPSMLSPNTHSVPSHMSITADFDIPRAQIITPLPSQEARSVFSDDSPRMRGDSCKRGRLSSLKARIAAPYSTRIGSKSYDDLTWRYRNRPEAAPSTSQRSASNLHSRSKSNDSKPLRHLAERMHRHRLKEKVQGWLKEARSAIKSRMKA